MTNQEIFDIINHFDKSLSQTMKLTIQDFSIELSKCTTTVASAVPQGSAVQVAPQSAPSTSVVSAPSGELITAPMVGTYYAAPAPGEEPFVSVGDKVGKGQTVCLMEAMKMMSEVTAPCDCIIKEVCKPNGELAEFGEPLFRYEPC